MGGDGLRGTSAYLFGRNTFEKMAGFWPHQGMENPIAAHMNSTPKYVVSRTLSTVDWAHSTLLSGEVNDEVRALKSSGTGDLAILGSGQLVRALMRAELLDGLRLFIHPLVIGSGKQLFGDLDSPRTLRLVNSKTTSMGTLVLSYDLGR